MMYNLFDMEMTQNVTHVVIQTIQSCGQNYWAIQVGSGIGSIKMVWNIIDGLILTYFSIKFEKYHPKTHRDFDFESAI